MNTDKVFIGREPERQKLESIFEKSGRGIGSFVALTGESGIGKNTLIRKFVEFAGEKDARICTVTIGSRDDSTLLAPFQEILRLLQPAGLTSKPEPVAGDDAVFTGTVMQDWENADFERLQTGFHFSQQKLLTSLLSAIGRQHVVIILHEIQNAQPSDLQFLHYFCKNIRDHRIILLLTACLNSNEKKAGRVATCQDVLQRMNRERLVQFIELKRFGEGEIRKFLFKLFGKTDFTNKFVPLLLEVTHGLPAALAKCIQVLIDQKIVYQQKGIWYNRDLVSRDDLQRVFSKEHDLKQAEAEISRLQNEAVGLLRFAALMDRTFDHQILAPVLGRSRIKVLQALYDLSDKKILLQIDEEKYDFHRPVLRMAVKRQIADAEKQQMHTALARAVREAVELTPEQRASLLAYHCAGAGEQEEALRALIDSANFALLSYAIAEARFAFIEAEKLAGENFSNLPATEAVQILLKYAWLERLLGERKSSLRRFQAARSLCRKIGDKNHEVQVSIQLGLTHYFLNQLEAAETCFVECLQMKNELREFDIAMANFGLGHVAFERGNYDDAGSYLQEALHIAEKLDAKRLLANIYNILGALENIKGLSMRAIVYYSRSTPIFEAIGDHSGLARIYHNIGMTHADLEDWRKADEFYSKSLRISDVMGLIALKSITFLNRALALAQLARLAEAEEYNTKAFHLLQRISDALGLAEYYKIQGVIELLKGDYAAAANNLERAIEDFKKHNNSLGIAESEYERAKVEEALQNSSAARNWYQKALDRFQNLGVEMKARRVRQELTALEKTHASVKVAEHKKSAHR